MVPINMSSKPEYRSSVNLINNSNNLVTSTPLPVKSGSGAISTSIINDINIPDLNAVIDIDEVLLSSDDNIEDVDIDHEITARPPSAQLPVNTESDDEEVKSLTQSTGDTYRLKLTPLYSEVLRKKRPRVSSPPTFAHNESTLAVKSDSDSGGDVPFTNSSTSSILKSLNGTYIDTFIDRPVARSQYKKNKF